MQTNGSTIHHEEIKVFHFQEIDWLICFPKHENEGRKYLHYAVAFADLKKNQQVTQAYLSDLVDNPLFENGFPFTVGYFKTSLSEGIKLPDCYLELRIVPCLEEFWKFLNDLNI